MWSKWSAWVSLFGARCGVGLESEAAEGCWARICGWAGEVAVAVAGAEGEDGVALGGEAGRGASPLKG